MDSTQSTQTNTLEVTAEQAAQALEWVRRFRADDPAGFRSAATSTHLVRTVPASVERFAVQLKASDVEAAHLQFSILTIDDLTRVVAWHEDEVKVSGCYVERRTTPSSEWRSTSSRLSMLAVRRVFAGAR